MKITPAATVLALAAAAAHAQDADENGRTLTADEARDFFGEVASDAEEAVRREDWAGIMNWFERHVTEDATIALRGTATMTGGMVASFEVVMDGAHLSRVAGMAMGAGGSGQAMSMPMDMIEDYALSTDVQAVNELPNGQVTAAVVFHESGRVAPPEEATGQEAPQAQAREMPELVFDQLSSCMIRLAPGEDEIRIVNVACESTAMM